MTTSPNIPRRRGVGEGWNGGRWMSCNERKLGLPGTLGGPVSCGCIFTIQDEGRLSSARLALEEALKLDPLSYIALRQLGDLDLAAGNYASAAAYLKRARSAKPGDTDLALAEGRALEKINDYAAARDVLEASLKSMPEALPARLALGRVYLALKNLGAAEDQYEAVLLLQPGNREAALGLARALIAGGKFGAAISQLRPLSNSDRQTPELFELLADAYRGAGNTVEAQAAKSHAKLLRRGFLR